MTLVRRASRACLLWSLGSRRSDRGETDLQGFLYLSRASFGLQGTAFTFTAVRCRVSHLSSYLLYSHLHIHLAYLHRRFRLAMHYFSQLCHYE